MCRPRRAVRANMREVRQAETWAFDLLLCLPARYLRITVSIDGRRVLSDKANTSEVGTRANPSSDQCLRSLASAAVQPGISLPRLLERVLGSRRGAFSSSS